MTLKNKLPTKEEVLTNDFSHYDNFFPIATVELNENGRSIPIHIIYIFFQATNADEKYFLEGEYGGNFSFELVDNLSRPTFKKRSTKN